MSEVDRPCPNCGHTLNGCSGLRSYGTYTTHDTAYCLQYLRDDRDALRAQNIALQFSLADTEALEMQHGAVAERLMADRDALRAQLAAAQAQVQTARDALDECCEEIDAYIQHEYPHDHPVQERCRQRDYAANPARIALALTQPTTDRPDAAKEE